VGYCNFRTFYDNTFISPPSSIIDLSKSKKRHTFYEIWVDKPLQKRNKKRPTGTPWL
jgi:adenylylsulfate kinase-like enzyme